jgi:simple sugar transport system permease protein
LKKIRKEKILLFFLQNISVFLIIIFFGIFAYLRPQGMLNINTIIFTLYSAIPIGFLVLAESTALISGNIDLSVDQVAGFAALVAGRILSDFTGFPVGLSIFLPIIIGIVAGMVNGIIVGRLRINSFVATLGTLMFFKGMKLVIGKRSIWGDELPKFYLSVGQNIYTTIIVFIIVLVILWLFFRYTKIGIGIYAAGGNSNSANMLGINLTKTYFITYMISGALCGIAALFYSGYINSIPVNIADGVMITAFAGSVIGGISLQGGRGSVIGAFGGILLLGLIETGLAMFAVASEIRVLSYGVLVVIAVIIASFKDSLRDRVLKYSN